VGVDRQQMTDIQAEIAQTESHWQYLEECYTRGTVGVIEKGGPGSGVASLTRD